MSELDHLVDFGRPYYDDANLKEIHSKIIDDFNSLNPETILKNDTLNPNTKGRGLMPRAT